VSNIHFVICKIIAKHKKSEMAAKKTIMEQAVLDAKQIQEALQANTKEILRSVAREEIDGLVKESLMEDDYEEETIGDEEGVEAPAEFGGDETDDAAVDIQTSDEVGPDGGQDLGMDVDTDVVDTDVDALGGDELDMTGESDDDVIAIYKKLSGEDQIEIVGDEIHLTVSEPGEYIVKAGDTAPEGIDTDPLADAPVDIDGGLEGGEDEEEMSYEIAMDDEEEGEETPDEFGGEETPEASPEEEGGEEETEEEEEETEEISEEDSKEEDVVEESIPVGTAQAHRLPGKANIGQPKGAGADNLKESTKPSKQVVTEAEVKYQKLLTEATKLKSENEQFRKALKKFRNMLAETVVYNANLTYVSKLFTEHSTTKEEKASIIKRFDEVTSLKESKKLYKSIVDELGSKKPIKEAVENKIIKEVTTSSSKKLNEATAYVDPSTQRIKDLIKRVENR
jgi:hypothetical protein